LDPQEATFRLLHVLLAEIFNRLGVAGVDLHLCRIAAPRHLIEETFGLVSRPVWSPWRAALPYGVPALPTLACAIHQNERDEIFRAARSKTLQLPVPNNVTALVKLGEFFVADFS